MVDFNLKTQSRNSSTSGEITGDFQVPTIKIPDGNMEHWKQGVRYKGLKGYFKVVWRALRQNVTGCELEVKRITRGALMRIDSIGPRVELDSSGVLL